MPRTKQEKAKLQATHFPIRVPINEYKESEGITYVTFPQIELYHTWDQVQHFDEWFQGQTGIMLEDGTLGVYVYDYERWLGGGR